MRTSPPSATRDARSMCQRDGVTPHRRAGARSVRCRRGNSSSEGGWRDERVRPCARQLSGCDLLRGVKRRGAALFEIAECEDPGAKLRERAAVGERPAAREAPAPKLRWRTAVGQCPAAHLLLHLSFAAGLDFAPVLLRIPLPIRPMLHLVGSLCLHRVPPMFRAAARVQIVFGDNRAPRVNYCEMSGRGVAEFQITADGARRLSSCAAMELRGSLTAY